MDRTPLPLRGWPGSRSPWAQHSTFCCGRPSPRTQVPRAPRPPTSPHRALRHHQLGRILSGHIPGPSGSHSVKLCGCAKELPNSSFPLRSVIDFYPWLCFLRVQLPAVNHGSKILNVNFQM